jgi:hypothetical protein
MLLAILGFNWDTRERLIKVETQLESHMNILQSARPRAAIADFLSTRVQADTVLINRKGQ